MAQICAPLFIVGANLCAVFWSSIPIKFSTSELPNHRLINSGGTEFPRMLPPTWNSSGSSYQSGNPWSRATQRREGCLISPFCSDIQAKVRRGCPGRLQNRDLVNVGTWGICRYLGRSPKRSLKIDYLLENLLKNFEQQS